MALSPKRIRWTSLSAFLLLTLPLLTWLSIGIGLLTPLWYVDTTIRAIPLYVAICIDWWFYDGGELSPELIGVWVALTGLLLWPLLALSIRPRLWMSFVWRRAFAGYTACAAVCTLFAAWWVFTHTGYLF